MASLLFDECCPECGHLLTNNRAECPFCWWSLQDNPVQKKMDGISVEDNTMLDGEEYLCILPTDDQLSAEAIL